MDTKKQAQVKIYARAIATLSYKKTDPETVKTLALIESAKDAGGSDNITVVLVGQN